MNNLLFGQVNLFGWLFLLIVVFVNFGCSGPDGQNSLRIGYPTEDDEVICGLGQVLERTNLLEQNDLSGKFTLYAHSFEVMWALIEENVDVVIIPDESLVPILLSGTPVEVIASFDANSPVALVVSPDSSIQRIGELKNSAVDNPIDIIRLTGWLKNADIKADEIKINRQRHLGYDWVERRLAERKNNAWMMRGAFLKNFTVSKKIKVLAEDKYNLTVIMLKKTIEDYPDKAINFLVAFHEAVFYQRHQPEIVLKWVRETSPLWSAPGPDITLPEKLDLAPKVEEIKPALVFIRNQDNFGLADHLRQYIELLKGSVIDSPEQINVNNIINQTLFEKSFVRLAQKGVFDASRIKIIHHVPPTIPFDNIILERFGWYNQSIAPSETKSNPFQSEFITIEEEHPDKSDQ
ncbi:MAG: hypothetical protein AAB019_08760 [Planctomycetota bacterium]